MSQKTRINILQFSNLKNYFEAVFAMAKEKNPQFTQAAFSKYLGCSASTLNNFMEGRRQLSGKMLAQIGKRLKWDTSELSHALSLRAVIESNDGFSQTISQLAETRNQSGNREVKKAEEPGSELSLLNVILIECVRIPEFEQDPVLAVERLGFSRELAQHALDKLIRQNVLQKTERNTYEKTGTSMVIVAEDRSEMLRNFYKQMLTAAIHRIRPENTESRYLGSETFAFDPELLPDAKKIVNRCLDDLASLSYRCKTPSTVYHAGFQLFELLEKLA